MPRIVEYTAQSDTLRPSETGVDAFAAAGRRIGAFYNQAGESEKQAAQDLARAGEGVARAEERKFSAFGDIASGGAMAGKSIAGLVQVAQDTEGHQEVSHGAATASVAGATLSQKWNDVARNADPNDPTIAGKFIQEEFEPWADNFRQSFQTPTGQRFAETQIAHIRDHLLEKSYADMSDMAGRAVRDNITKMSSAWSNNALSDPSSVPFLLANAPRLIGAVVSTSPNLSPRDAAALHADVLDQAQRNIVRAGGAGILQNAADPEAAWKAYAARYPDLIDAQEGVHFAAVARGAAHVNEQHTDARQGAAQQASLTDFRGKATDLMDGTNVASGNPQLSPDYWSQYKQLLTHPGADTATMSNAYELGRALTYRMKTNAPDPEPPASHAATMDLLAQMRSGSLTPADVYKAYGSQKINGSDLAMLDAKLKALQTPQGQALERREAGFIQSIAPTITRGLGDQDAKLHLYDFQMNVDRRVADYTKAGKNPVDLFDPSNPDYLGAAPALSAFQKPSLQATLPTIAAGKKPIASDVPARKPGETLPQWLERTGRGLPPASAMPSVPMSQ
jgi:hypothetical protein